MADNENNFFIGMEHDVMKFWEDNDCFGKLREQNKGHEMFRFLDGPITANNPMGIHHAWGRSLKDIFLRYKGMQGYDCRYQNGFDSQGLWVEVEVEKELGFETVVVESRDEAIDFYHKLGYRSDGSSLHDGGTFICQHMEKNI